MSRSHWLKLIAASLAILSGLVVTNINPNLNNGLLYASFPKYYKIDEALKSLSSFKQVQFNTQNGLQNFTTSTLLKENPGFNEILNVIYKKRIIQFDKNVVTKIHLIKSGTGISIASIEATPQYMLGIVVDNNVNVLSVMYKDELQLWVENEKQFDTQTLSFFILLFAVGFDLLADFDLTYILEKGKNFITPSETDSL